MDKINRWKLADELTAYQIALLIAGYDPSEFERDNPREWPSEVKLDISPFINAIKNATRSKTLVCTLVMTEDAYAGSEIDWSETVINIESLCEWLRLRNFRDGFFIAGSHEVDKLADPSGEFYAPKLAAAVRAWKEVTADPQSLNGKTPKRALEVWLRKHANEYGLANKDGNPNIQGIEEISKVANWKPAGGASPTPGTKLAVVDSRSVLNSSDWERKARPTTGRANSPTRRLNPPTPSEAIPLIGTDDDIPF